ncbi:hypothetical protein LCGC14_2496780 [marine sediment metagenome]|uniref:Uncharacterized protein n=1 Tax=marine sediment metagenome TaxID=412755 RepID=A0A0F9DWW3_9ZZZZ
MNISRNKLLIISFLLIWFVGLTILLDYNDNRNFREDQGHSDFFNLEVESKYITKITKK